MLTVLLIISTIIVVIGILFYCKMIKPKKTGEKGTPPIDRYPLW